MFCHTRRHQPNKTGKKSKPKPSKEEYVVFLFSAIDPYNLAVLTHKIPRYRFYNLNSFVPPFISARPEFIQWKQSRLDTLKLQEEIQKSLSSKPEYTKKLFDKTSRYRKLSSVYSKLRQTTVNQAVYETLYS